MPTVRWSVVEVRKLRSVGQPLSGLAESRTVTSPRTGSSAAPGGGV